MASPLITLLDSNNQLIGPYPAEDVRRRLQSGEFRPDQLAYVEGLLQWTPLTEVLAHIQGSSLPPVYVPSAAATPYVSAYTPMTYAGFWLRFVAYLLDGLLLWTVLYAVFAILMLIGNPHAFLEDLSGKVHHEASEMMPLWVQLLFFPLFIFGPLLYFAWMESGPKQGTLGKMALGLKVTDLFGNRLGFWHAFARTLAKVITNFTCILFYVGYMMAGFTEKKQALHDMIAGTLVWKR